MLVHPVAPAHGAFASTPAVDLEELRGVGSGNTLRQLRFQLIEVALLVIGGSFGARRIDRAHLIGLIITTVVPVGRNLARSPSTVGFRAHERVRALVPNPISLP